MTRNDLVDRCKQLLEEAYTEVTEMVVAYLEIHPEEPRLTLCREIDPDNYRSLDSRVVRLQEKRRSELSPAPIDQSLRTATQNVRTGRSAH